MDVPTYSDPLLSIIRLVKTSKDQLYYPFSININPFMEDAKKETLHWLKEFNFIVDNKTFENEVRKKMWELAAYSYPNVSLDFLSLYSELISLLFLTDDEYDDQSLGNDPEQLSKTINEYYEIVCLRETNLDSNIKIAFQDIARRINYMADKSLITQFQESIKKYFDGCFKQTLFKKTNKMLNLDEYYEVRLLTAGMYPFFDLIEFSLTKKLPLYFKSSPEFLIFREIASFVIAFANDIYSFPKEFNHESSCKNLITILMSEKNITFKKAYEEAVNLHNSKIWQFIEFENKVISQVKEKQDIQVIQEWINGLKDWMIGLWQWTLDSDRYVVDLNHHLSCSGTQVIKNKSLSNIEGNCFG